MKRRSFIKKSIAVASAPFITSGLFARTLMERPIGEKPFNLNYAPHFGMFKNNAGEDPIDQLQFMYDYGFRSLEDNGMKGRTVELQKKIAKKMSRLGMDMGVFVAHKIYWREPNLTSGDKTLQNEFVQNVKDSVEVAKRVNATWMTVVPGHVDLRKEMAYQTANVVEALRRASEVLEPHGLIMVLEPLNWWANHAGQFLTEIPQAYEICRAVNSSSCKILFDIYHQQISEGNLIPNMDKSWKEIAYFQIGDNPGRKEPTTGEINYLNVFKHIHNKGFRGIMGMEHGNSRPGKAGEMAVIEAYRQSDNF
ncbi:MAG: TIM barrel protein [Candidatus Marinimicrobia bacterium]|nr:TIM barrel protein [Candidatus Neomarinimicrobiota bacterium]